jgi:glycosyltransferase involved in cell wall biosynthesis
MNFLILADDYSATPGGIEYHAVHLAHQLRALGHRADIRGPHIPELFRSREVDWIVFEGVHRPLLESLLWIRRRIAPRLAIFTHGSFYEFIHGPELDRLGFRSFPRGHNLKFVLDRAFMSRILRHMTAVFVLSPIEKHELEFHFDLDPSRVFFLDNFYDEALPSRGRIPDSGRWANLTPYICAVGRVDRRKNYSSVIEAIDGVDVRFLLAGRNVRNGLSQVLETARAHRNANFQYLGRIADEEKFDLISSSVGTILPSYFEGVPFGVIESLALGKPAICTAHSYMPRREGMISCEPNTASVRAAILKLLTDPPQITSVEFPTEREVVSEFLDRLPA